MTLIFRAEPQPDPPDDTPRAAEPSAAGAEGVLASIAPAEPRPRSSAQGEADVLKQFLAVRLSACPCCRYELTGLEGSRCPECGAALRLVLTAKRSARELLSERLWLIGIVGPCTALGVLTLEAARLVLSHWVGLTPRGGLGTWSFWNRMLLFAGSLLLVYLWGGTRDIMGRQNPVIAMMLAQLAWVLAVGLLAVNQYVLL